MSYWLLYVWHIVSFAKKFRYEYSWGEWSDWCDFHYATLGINHRFYTGRIEYNPSAKDTRVRVKVVHVRKATR